MTEFTSRLLDIIKNIPYGRVITYGRVAEIAGNPRAARQVAWVLNAYSNNNLPWHRIINSKGMISLKRGQGFEIQKVMLEEEGIFVDDKGRINLQKYIWNGELGDK